MGVLTKCGGCRSLKLQLASESGTSNLQKKVVQNLIVLEFQNLQKLQWFFACVEQKHQSSWCFVASTVDLGEEGG